MAETRKVKRVGILQPGYLPWLGYFNLVHLSDVFVFYDDVQFTKNDWRNRNRLLCNGSPQWITVPVSHKGQFPQLIKDVAVVPGPWVKKHLKTIQTLYGRAPFYDWFYPQLEAYLTAREYAWLLDLCLEGHGLLSKCLRLNRETRLSSDIGYSGIGRTERLVAVCKELDAACYVATNASKTYMREHLWREAGIDLRYQNYEPPVYPQFTQPFVSHLSVVDAFMFLGPDAAKLIGTPDLEQRATSLSDSVQES